MQGARGERAGRGRRGLQQGVGASCGAGRCALPPFLVASSPVVPWVLHCRARAGRERPGTQGAATRSASLPATSTGLCTRSSNFGCPRTQGVFTLRFAAGPHFALAAPWARQVWGPCFAEWSRCPGPALGSRCWHTQQPPRTARGWWDPRTVRGGAVQGSDARAAGKARQHGGLCMSQGRCWGSRRRVTLLSSLSPRRALSCCEDGRLLPRPGAGDAGERRPDAAVGAAAGPAGAGDGRGRPSHLQ